MRTCAPSIATVLACLVGAACVHSPSRADLPAGTDDERQAPENEASTESGLPESVEVPAAKKPWDDHDPRVPLAFLGTAGRFTPADDEREASSEVPGNADASRLDPRGARLGTYLAWRSGHRWRIDFISGAASLQECEWDDEHRMFQCEAGWIVRVSAVGPPRQMEAEAWEAWRYVTDLVRVDEPLFKSCSDVCLDEKESRDALQEALRLESEGDAAALLAFVERLGRLRWLEGQWHELRARAARRGEPALVAALFARLGLPAGRCSQDATPIYALLEYADACLAAGRINCFAHLVVWAMADAGPRVAWSTSALPAFRSQSLHLHKGGIDLQRFLTGLVLYYRADPPRDAELSPWHLAAAIRHGDLEEAMDAPLVAMLTNEALDDFNRLRAAQVRYHVLMPPEDRDVWKPGRSEAQRIAARRDQVKDLLERKLAVLDDLSELDAGLLGNKWVRDLRDSAAAELEEQLARYDEELAKARERDWRERKVRAQRNAEQIATGLAFPLPRPSLRYMLRGTEYDGMDMREICRMVDWKALGKSATGKVLKEMKEACEHIRK